MSNSILNYYQKVSRLSRTPIVMGASAARTMGARYMLLRTDTTNVCNLACKMCYFSLDVVKKRRVEAMTEDQFTDFAEKMFPYTKRLFLSCKTEPFMNKNFSRFLEITREYDVPFVSYITNATLMTEDHIEATLDNNVNQVIISVDGYKKETIEGIRIKLKYESFIKRIKLLTTAIQERPNCQTSVRFNMVVMNSNVDELLGVVQMALDLKVSELQFRVVHSRDAYDYEFGTEINMDMSDESEGVSQKMRSLRPQVEKLVSGTNLKVYYPRDTDHSVESIECSYPWFNHYVDSQGNFYPCAYLPSVGNVFEAKSFNDLFNSNASQSIKTEVKCNKRQECKDCEALERLYNQFDVL